MMPRRWQIACYIDAAGCQPVLEYMYDGMNINDLDVIIGVIQRLSRAGQALVETNAAKPIDGPIYELRPNRHRIMYAEDQPKNRFVLLSAFLKKTQKTPPEEIKKAKEYWDDYLHTGNCEVLRFGFEDN